MKLPAGHVAGQGVAKPKCTGGFGERMLREMGWEAGQGLGKQGTGIKEAIQVKKKEDTVGVGGNGSYDWGAKWWEKAFDSAVHTLGDSDSSSSSASDSDSDDERMAAVVAAVNRDGTRTSASADELKLLASLSKGGRVAAGRFGGRDAKLARIRQQEAAMAAAAAAKLGVPSAPSVPATDTVEGGSDDSETTSEVKLSRGKKRKSGGEAEASGDGAKKKKKQKSAGKSGKGASAEDDGGQQQAAQQQPQQPKKERIVIEPVVANSGPTYDFVPTPATGWWGEKLFASAGCLEGLDKTAAEAQRRRVTFDEDDQARIYNTAQAKKTQGKVGLGQGTGTVKVGGVKWEGKRVSFEEEPEAETCGGEVAAAVGAAALAATGSCTHLDRLAGGRGAGQGAAAAAGQAAAAVEGWAAAIKWKKIIVGQLQAAEAKQLRVKELQRLVVAAVLAKHSSIVQSKAAVKAALAERLGSSSKWAVQGKLVRLRT